MDNITPINQFATPTGAQLEPQESSKPILTGYELHPVNTGFWSILEDDR